MGVMGIILGTFERKNEMGGENEEHLGTTCGEHKPSAVSLSTTHNLNESQITYSLNHSKKLC
jgi:hypothetical protein